MFEHKHYKDSERVQLTKPKTRKGGMHWWTDVKTSRDTTCLPRITRWCDKKHEFEKRYIPPTYEQDRSERIVGFKQGSTSVAEYCDEFHTLRSRADVEEPLYITVVVTKEV